MKQPLASSGIARLVKEADGVEVSEQIGGGLVIETAALDASAAPSSPTWSGRGSTWCWPVRRA